MARRKFLIVQMYEARQDKSAAKGVLVTTS
jgi:hypothetical protein